MRIEEDIFLPDSDPEIEVERPNTFRKVAIFLAVAAGLGVSCLAVGAFFYVVFKGASRAKFENGLADRRVVMPPPQNETYDQRQTDVRAGFGGSPSGADQQTLAGVNAYFDKLIEATRGNDANRFRSLMSARRFMDEVKKRGLIRQLNQSDEEAMIKDFAEKWLSIPVNWSRYRIANVRSSNYWRDAVVYVYFWDETQSISEVRFWLTREGEGWIAYDWELLEFGVRESMTAAAFIHYGNDPRLNEHIQAASEAGQAYRQSREGNRDAAVALVTQAEKRRSVPELADRLAVDIAYTWRSLGQPRQALLAARKVKSPRMAAGALFVQAEVYEQYGLHRRALEFARQYEEAIGAGPASAGLLANIHGRLGNRAEASKYRQAVLRYDPDNAQSLMALAEVIDDSQQKLLLDLIRQTSAPVERAANLVARVAYVGDPQVARAVADFVIESEPESARAAVVEARLAKAQGEHEHAAAQFKIAWERSADDERETYVAEYLTAKAAAGKSLEGYEQAPDPAKAFVHFASGGADDDEALPREALDALFAAHRLRFPEDPWLHFYSGQRFQEKQDYSAAEREYRAAIEHAGEDDVATFRNSLLFLLLQAGKVLDAYQGILPPEEAFQRIVDRSRWSQPPADLTELHKQHSAAFPNDPRLDSCAAIIEKAAGNSAEALRLAMRGYDATGDEPTKAAYRQQVVSLALETGDQASVYKVQPTPDDALRTLIRRTRRSDERRQVQALLDQHKSRYPITLTWRTLQAEQQWNDRDYAGVVSTLEPSAEAMLELLPDWEVDRYVSWYAHSLFHAGRGEAAKTFAELACDQFGKPLPLIYACLREVNIAEIERLLGEFGTDTWKINEVFDDPEAGPILRSAEFLPVRRVFPPILSPGFYWDSVVLLRGTVSDTTRDATAGTILSTARSVWGAECAVEPFESPAEIPAKGIVGSWLVRAGQRGWIVTAGEGRFFAEAEAESGLPQPKKPALVEALSQHRGWFKIQPLRTDRHPAEERAAWGETYRFAARLRDDQCLAMQFSMGNILAPNSADLGTLLESDDPDLKLADLGETFWWPRHGDVESPDDTKRDAAFSRSLAEFATAFDKRTPDQIFEFIILVRFDDVGELLRVQLEQNQRTLYRGRTWRGTLLTDSRLVPEFSTGEPISVSDFQIVEWSYSRGEQIEWAKR